MCKIGSQRISTGHQQKKLQKRVEKLTFGKNINDKFNEKKCFENKMTKEIIITTF